jgi:hypothetical protein
MVYLFLNVLISFREKIEVHAFVCDHFLSPSLF